MAFIFSQENFFDVYSRATSIKSEGQNYSFHSLEDNVEFESETMKNVNELKGVKYTFSSACTSLVFHLHLQLLQEK